MTEFETIIYTIGHSTHPIEQFLRLLRQSSIQTLGDIRTHPTSRFHPQFRQNALKKSLLEGGIDYIFLGQELGGHPDEAELYDGGGHVIYERIATTSPFRNGIRRVGEIASSTRLVLMCAEGNPSECHRHPLLARELVMRGFRVLHICRDGSLQNARDMFEKPTDPQLPLIEPPGEDLSWRSPKRIR